MKKLLTVFTAAGLLVAGGSSALALQNTGDYVENIENDNFVPFEGATDTDPGHLSKKVDNELREQYAKRGHQRTADKDGGVWVTGQDGKRVFVPAKKGAAPTKKAEPNKGLRSLPRTSAVK